MRLAVIGDVHANVPALNAVIEDASRAGAAATYCVGDIVGRGPHPNEVVDVMRRHDIASVQGNWDEAVAMDRDSPGAAWETLEAEAAGLASMHWTAAALTDENKAWLRLVPVRGRVVIDGRSVAFFHGSHIRQTEYLWSDRPSRLYSRLASEEGDDVFCFGHTHETFHRVVGQAHLVACGSVGCPVPGAATATYALLDIGDGRVVVGFRSVEYDLASVMRDMTAAGLPRELLLDPPPRHALPLHASITA